MKQIRSFGMIVIAVLLIGGLAACTRSLSGVPDASTETEPVSEGSDALPTDDIMAQLGAFATQTAMVQQGELPFSKPRHPLAMPPLKPQQAKRLLCQLL